jgi:hypothetical protein
MAPVLSKLGTKLKVRMKTVHSERRKKKGGGGGGEGTKLGILIQIGPHMTSTPQCGYLPLLVPSLL